jgi:hypothetical protein
LNKLSIVRLDCSPTTVEPFNRSMWELVTVWRCQIYYVQPTLRDLVNLGRTSNHAKAIFSGAMFGQHLYVDLSSSHNDTSPTKSAPGRGQPFTSEITGSTSRSVYECAPTSWCYFLPFWVRILSGVALCDHNNGQQNLRRHTYFAQFPDVLCLCRQRLFHFPRFAFCPMVCVWSSPSIRQAFERSKKQLNKKFAFVPPKSLTTCDRSSPRDLSR